MACPLSSNTGPPRLDDTLLIPFVCSGYRVSTHTGNAWKNPGTKPGFFLHAIFLYHAIVKEDELEGDGGEQGIENLNLAKNPPEQSFAQNEYRPTCYKCHSQATQSPFPA